MKRPKKKEKATVSRAMRILAYVGIVIGIESSRVMNLFARLRLRKPA